MYKLKKQEGNARRGELETPHGTVQTPVFMNVGTAAAIKGALSAVDLKTIGCQVELSNTYHLHLRPGDELVRDMGGLHKFMTWDGPILTDSGGFQIFSLASLRKISEEGVKFNSHIDGRHIFMGPEESMRIQANLGSDIAMAFDECIKIPSPREYVEKSCDRTYRWLVRCKAALSEYNSREDAIQAVEEYMPKDKPRYLMGVGTPGNIIEGVARGVDFFDCVMPARNGRHGHLFTWNGIINIKNEKYLRDEQPIDSECDCPVCKRYSRAYVRHLFKANEMLAMRFAVMHNLYFYNKLMEKIRMSLDNDNFEQFRSKYTKMLDTRI